MKLRERLLESGWAPVDLKSGNVKVGDNIVNHNDLFGTLIKVTKTGGYLVRFDIDYADERPTRYTREEFESGFLVDRRTR